MDALLEILKWVILILLAGFIGQFGRTTSHHLMDYFRKRKEQRVSTASPEINETKAVSTEPFETNAVRKEVILPTKEQEEKQRSKAEKKTLKAQLKARKKSEKLKRNDEEK